MAKPVCVPCARPLEISRIGIVVEFTRKGKDKVQLPYKKAVGDILLCPQCGVRVITKYGQDIEHFDPSYATLTAHIVVPE